MNEINYYREAFSSLHTAKAKGYKAPHKAVLLLSIIELVEEGVIASPRIELTDELERKFNEVWHRYLGTSAIFTPDIGKPYFHMQYESFWRLVEHHEIQMGMAAESKPFVSVGKESKEHTGSYSVKALRRAFAYAEIDGLLFQTLSNADSRAMFRVTLISTYFTNQPTKTNPDWSSLMLLLPFVTLVA